MTKPRLLVVPIVLALLALQVGPVVAFTAEPEETETTVSDQPSSGIQPAVQAPPEEAEDEEQPWTSRFLAPLTLLLGLLVLVAAGLYYAVRIRRRYRIVD